jgi:hydroxymethylbilane synthase
MDRTIRIGTRDSQLALWQANTVRELLEKEGYHAELVLIKSEGDLDLVTPLYELGVQGIFTRSLDIALLRNQIDLAVHSMKDVPTALPKGIAQAAVLARASYKDILVPKNDTAFMRDKQAAAIIATSSIRRKAQWLNRYPNHSLENLRGNVNTRLQKVASNNWHGAIFAAAGLERINLRPANAIDLDWMLPAPAQGAIMVVCREDDEPVLNACQPFNDAATALCARIERDFLRALMGGCSTPISALAKIEDGQVQFQGNVLSPDGKNKIEIKQAVPMAEAEHLGTVAGETLLGQGAKAILEAI